MSASLALQWQECPAVPYFLPGTVEPIRPLPSAGPRIGLALGGGSARGWAHIGVIRALEEGGIHPTVVAGCSIGAVVGACYAAGRLDRLETFARELTRHRVVRLIDPRFPGSGLIAGNRLRRRLFADLGTRRIESLPIRFGCVATEFGSGLEVSLTEGPTVEAVRASYAIPGLFPPVTHEGRVLMDGTLVNPVPVALARTLGADLVICVNLNGDTGGPVVHEVPTPAARRSFLQVIRACLPGFEPQEPEIPVPGIARVVLGAFNITQDRISGRGWNATRRTWRSARMSPASACSTFTRPPRGIDIGYRAARAALPRIRAVVNGAAARARALAAGGVAPEDRHAVVTSGCDGPSST